MNQTTQNNQTISTNPNLQTARETSLKQNPNVASFFAFRKQTTGEQVLTLLFFSKDANINNKPNLYHPVALSPSQAKEGAQSLPFLLEFQEENCTGYAN